MASRLAALLLAAALVAPSLSGHQAAPPAAGRPALLVLLVVDQFRYEYVTRFHAIWTGGFRRLLDTGAVFDEARYPYLNTVTCAGHATIATGAFPATHGIVLNEWWDDASQKRVPCTGDTTVESLPYGGRPESIGHSAHYLQVPTFGDRLRRHSPSSRVVSLSIKPRSAVMMAGHGGTATWFASTDTWATSTAFMPAPAPIVAAYVKAHGVEDDRNAVWQRAKAPDFYTGDDLSAVEWARRGWSTTFPHPLSGAPGTPARGFYALWERSPFSDAYLGRMAARIAEDFALGSRNATDLLAVSFSAVDYVGHDFGPDSHEAQDTVVRLDAVLGDLLNALDRHVGKDRYVVALSADHGVGPIPELRQQAGLDAGRVLAKDVRTVAEKVLAVLGPDRKSVV